MKKGMKMSDEQKRKISLARTGKYRGKNNPKWRGGKMMVSGYMYIYSPNHPNKTQAGYVCEHRLVMEKKLGRYLDRSELVHHINHIKTDNRKENLILTNNHEHMKNHQEVFDKQRIDFKGKHFNKENEFVKGYTWNTGKHLSEEHKRKISEGRRRFYGK